MSQDKGAYMLDVDASNRAAGAVLQQEQGGMLCVIAYASKAFTGAEKRYCITRKELAAMIFGIKNYRKYLLGRKFFIRTDHAALSYLMTAKDLIGQQARWVDLLSEFDFTIQHRPGVSPTNADAFSRKIPCELGGIDCRQCHKHIRSTFDMPDGRECSRIRFGAAGRGPVAHRHRNDILWAQPVRTRAQARVATEKGEPAVPTLQPYPQTSSDIYELALDQ